MTPRRGVAVATVSVIGSDVMVKFSLPLSLDMLLEFVLDIPELFDRSFRHEER